MIFILSHKNKKTALGLVLNGSVKPATLQRIKTFDPATDDIVKAIKDPKKYFWIDPRKLTTPQLLECLRLLHPEHYEKTKNAFPNNQINIK